LKAVFDDFLEVSMSPWKNEPNPRIQMKKQTNATDVLSTVQRFLFSALPVLYKDQPESFFSNEAFVQSSLLGDNMNIFAVFANIGNSRRCTTYLILVARVN
jgi:hypothetical protein